MSGAQRSPSPPGLFRRLLSSALPSGIRGETILGDLEEEFCTAAARGSPRRARAWYRRQVFRVLTRYALVRTLTRNGSQLPSGPRLGRPEPPLRAMAEDVRYALRGLAERPGFTAAAVAALALGIGANTAVFSVLNAVLLRGLPFEHPERVVQMWRSPPLDRPAAEWPMSKMNLEDYEDRNRVFEYFAPMQREFLYTPGSERVKRVEALELSPDYFAMTGVSPLLGRTLVPDDYNRSVVVLSYGYWQREFGGAGNVLERTLVLRQYGESPEFEAGKSDRWAYLSREFDIVGVLPASFELPPLRLETEYRVWSRPDVVLPPGEQVYPPPGPRRRGYLTYRVLAQLRPGVTLEQARADIGSIAAGDRSRPASPGSTRTMSERDTERS